MKRRVWTHEEEVSLKEIYPTTVTSELCQRFKVKEHQLYNKAFQMGLKKSDEYLNKHVFTINTETGRIFRYPKGHKPWNKGLKGLQIGGEETQFKPGRTPHNKKPVGYRRISKEGYIEVKTAAGFKHLHRLVWEKANGTIPTGFAVIFKDSNKLNVSIENLELVSRGKLMKKNTFLNYPEETIKLVRAKSVLTRVINQKLQGGTENE